MSRFTKLLRNVLDGISDEKSVESIWDQPAKDPDKLLGEGIEGLKKIWSNAAAAADSADNITMSQLVRQQNKQNRQLTENYDRFLSCKRIWIADESRSKLDSTIQRAYFGKNGIRFYARILQENASGLDPKHQDTEKMVILCYNGAIIPMLDLHQIMEEKCRVLDAEIEAAATALANTSSLHRALGYTPCGNRIKELKAQIAAGLSADPQAEFCTIKKILDTNGEALEKMLQLSDPMPEPTALKNAALRTDLAQMLDAEHLKPLSTAENWTPECYAEAIRNLVSEFETRVLTRYLLPSEMDAKNEAC